MAITTVNPSTGEEIASYTEMSSSQIAEILSSTEEAFQSWRRVGLNDRIDALRRLAGRLREHAGNYAQLMAEEMGKPLSAGEQEIHKCA